jgi:hypothetical protein
MVSPPIDPWTQMGQWQRVHWLLFGACVQRAG